MWNVDVDETEKEKPFLRNCLRAREKREKKKEKKEMKNIKFCICNDHKDLITFMESTVCSITILQVRVGICGYLKVLASCLFNVFARVH